LLLYAGFEVYGDRINLNMTLHEIGDFHNSDVEISVFWDVTRRRYSATSACPPSCMAPYTRSDHNIKVLLAKYNVQHDSTVGYAVCYVQLQN